MTLAVSALRQANDADPASPLQLPLAIVSFSIAPLAMLGLTALWLHLKGKDNNDFVAVAPDHGLTLDARLKAPPNLPFPFFRRHRGRISNQMWRTGSHNSVFRFQFRTEYIKWNWNRRFTCALIALPFWAPHTKVGAGPIWHQTGGPGGATHVHVNSERLDHVYQITSNDERFATALLDSTFGTWFADQHPSNPHEVVMELHGPWMLLTRAKLPASLHVGFLNWAESVPRHVPDGLAARWPIPAGPAA